MLAVIAGAVLLTGCQQKNAATVNVKVVKLGVPQPNVQVYMFRGDLSDAFLDNKVHANKNIATAQPNVQVYMFRGDLSDAFLDNKVHANKNIATDENGIAEFEINSLSFGVSSDQATFIFETFDENEEVNGKVAATVKKGTSKDVTLNMDIL